MNISLGEVFLRYIEQQLAGGKYNNASEVVRDALRLKMQADEEYEAKLAALRRDVQIALDQAAGGKVVPATTAELRAKFRISR